MLLIPFTTSILLIPSQELLQPQSCVEEPLVRDFLFKNDDFASENNIIKTKRTIKLEG